MESISVRPQSSLLKLPTDGGVEKINTYLGEWLITLNGLEYSPKYSQNGSSAGYYDERYLIGIINIDNKQQTVRFNMFR